MLVACKFPMQDLEKVRIDTDSSKCDILNFMKAGDVGLKFETAKKGYCKTIANKVTSICICNTPWIEGSTSTAVYGEMQEEFNAHNCLKCNEWYHTHCLRYYNVSLPSRKGGFKCMQCDIPDSLRWHHDIYTNTCTVDNFLTIMLLFAKQTPTFLSKFVANEIEDNLKSSLLLMLKGKLQEGKTSILQYFHSRLNLELVPRGTKYNFFGGEYSQCLCLFSHIWKLSIQLICSSPHCPNNNQTICRFPSTYSFSNPVSFQDEIHQQFPQIGSEYGYCGAEFQCHPPPDALYALNDRINADDNEDDSRHAFYECRGKPKVQAIGFVRPNPWMIPINIASLSGRHIKSIPQTISIFNVCYKLAGITLNSSNHFTAVIPWFTKEFYYDGIPSTKEQRLIPMKDSLLTDKVGSYAYYCITDV